MLKLFINGGDYYDESRNEFIHVEPQALQLEHSLLSIAKWESKWNRSFLNDGPKTSTEKMSYLEDMTLTKNVNPNIYKVMSTKQRRQIDAYCKLPMTATTISNTGSKKGGPKKIITAEIIYYWMVSFNIPFECEKWHLNRLLMLIQVCSEKSKSPKKESPKEAAARHRAINSQRRRPRH